MHLAFGLVIVWALVGVIVKQVENQSVTSIAAAGIAVTLVTLTIRIALARS
jgi:hypothetical protein